MRLERNKPTMEGSTTLKSFSGVGESITNQLVGMTYQLPCQCLT